MSRARVALALSLLACGAGLLGEQGWLALKAVAAEKLIERAFEARLRDGAVHRPWSWADTHPIARLDLPRLGVRRTVLSGASGTSLAFGPGHLDGTAAPNAAGNSVIAGHRDTWFAFLEHVVVGDAIRLSTMERVREYRVVDLSIRSARDTQVVAPSDATTLTLVTCWPFDAWTPGPLRYVVQARSLSESSPVSRGQAPRATEPPAGASTSAETGALREAYATARRSLPRGRRTRPDVRSRSARSCTPAPAVRARSRPCRAADRTCTGCPSSARRRASPSGFAAASGRARRRCDGAARAGRAPAAA
ncbi:MAG: class GN sortase [bacterium]|nr:class GN sortase [bacterium]